MQLLVTEAYEEGVVLASVVEDEDFVDPVPYVFRDAIEDLTQGLDGVVGDDEDRDLLARNRLDPDFLAGGAESSHQALRDHAASSVVRDSTPIERDGYPLCRAASYLSLPLTRSNQ